MAIKLKKEHFEEIDSAFAGILEGKDKTANLGKIEKVLNQCFDMNFKITIITPKRNEPFYIMSVFPTESTIQKLVASILNEESDTKLKDIWAENKDWHIEIDNRILTGSFVDATSKELTALLLHELGHIIYSNSIPQRMSKVMKYEYAKANIGTKNILRNGLFKKILEIPILKACVFENYRTKVDQKRELKADVFAVKMGYGDELDSVLTKIIAKSSVNKPTAAHIDQSSNDVYDAMKSDTLSSIRLVESLKDREAKVSKANMQKAILDMPSEYINKMMSGLYSAMFKPDNLKTESMKEDTMVEAACMLYESAYTTEAFAIFRKKMKRVDPSIIDYINIRKIDMKSNDDKLMLVSYIHSKIDLLDYYLDIMNNPKYMKKYTFANSKNELVRMRAELEKSRQEILSYRIPEVRYGIQIMYPAGYEG